jgi:hypothetical protein
MELSGQFLAVPYLRPLVARLPTAADRVRAQVRSCEICGGKSGIGVVFLLGLLFPLPILIIPHSSSGAGTIRQIVPDVTKWTQSYHTPRKEETKN